MSNGIDFSEQFTDAFTAYGSPVAECSCGKTHVAIDSDCLDDGSTEMADYYNAQSKIDNTIVLHDGCDQLDIISIYSQHYVGACECKKWMRYMDFIEHERNAIIRFLVGMETKAKRVADMYEVEQTLKRSY